jgi:hypothetical protein
MRNVHPQVGGAACFLLDKWTGISIDFYDTKGLGGCSGFHIQDQIFFNIEVLSPYRPTSSSDVGNFRSYSQKGRILRRQYEVQPNPIETFMTDLTTLIQQWESLIYKIMIGVDMNEFLTMARFKVLNMINNRSLQPLLDIEKAPATYTRGSASIDFLLGTPKII